MAPPSFAPADNGFKRAIDPAIIKISASEVFSLEEATKAARKLLADADMATTDITIEGGNVNNRFQIRFPGDAGAASKLVRSCLDAQRLSKTEWRRNEVLSSDKNTVRLNVNPDKNSATVRTEIALKQVLAALKAQYSPGKTFQIPNRSEGIITVGWRRLVKIEAVDSSCTKLHWWKTGGEPEFVKQGIDKSLIEQKFEEVSGCGGEGSWS